MPAQALRAECPSFLGVQSKRLESEMAWVRGGQRAFGSGRTFGPGNRDLCPGLSYGHNLATGLERGKASSFQMSPSPSAERIKR